MVTAQENHNKQDSSKTVVQPDWIVVALDETYGWDKEFLARIGVTKMFGTYLFDKNRQVHCCELTPSYELHPIESLPKEFVSEAADEEIRDAHARSDEVTYMHCSAIDKLPASHFDAVSGEDLDLDEDDPYKAALQSTLEYLHGNQHCPAVVME